MSENKTYKAAAGWLASAIEALNGADIEVLAPVADEAGIVSLAPVTSANDVCSDALNTLVPLKKIFFPRTEVLMNYKTGGEDGVEVRSPKEEVHEKIIIGSRPCDAASLEVFDAVFHWDYDDTGYSKRRESATVVTVACTAPDAKCFCTTVGGSPQDVRGSDAIIYNLDDGNSIVAALTEKGEAFAERLSAVLKPVEDVDIPKAPELELKFDPHKVKQWLDDNFESEFWSEAALRCVGCGACSYLCPTCHCFDIVDESTWNHGERRRNWDCCSFGTFTLHASGHNPRADQTARYRQRVMHKFKYIPDRFEKIACVGCGRCVRKCGVGQSIVQVLEDIGAK
ncbi:4Fe-4S dicluster domain-containing protein [Candidatus Hydrogenedentota bacterium]